MFEETEKHAGYSIERLKESDVVPVAELYAQVFAEPPWNEYTRCGNCFRFFGRETEPGQACGNCGEPLNLAYPPEETTVDIREETLKPNAALFVIKESPVSGFAWGFSYPSPEEFAQEKYRTMEMQAKVAAALAKNGITGELFYFSECGVGPEKRGRGLSNYLTEQIIRAAKTQNLPLVMRTNCQSPMMAVAERFGFTQIMGPKAEIDRTAKTIRPTAEVVNDFLDAEIPERALFVKF
jgi:predicted GNAT family acetyltransferase